ncbi:hypothetical protein ACFWFF_32260, partial [Streptomyces sp. NPDC060223]
MSDVPPTADVVVGGGCSAGAVLAARLSQDPARTVLLLGAGRVHAADAYPPALEATRLQARAVSGRRNAKCWSPSWNGAAAHPCSG